MIRAVLRMPEERYGLGRDRQLARFTPFMVQALSSGATAVIAPNDRQGVRVCRWLVAAGIPFGEPLSVLAFDNSLAKIPAGLASIDFGYAVLGYAAFHALLGDVPTRASRGGDIVAPAELSPGPSLVPVRGGQPVVSAFPPSRMYVS
jgi:DNA-binding LacI/PurR family transcriptional regulator